jgi:hypothetical protein
MISEKKRNSISISKKKEILSYYDENCDMMSVSDISVALNIPRTTLNGIIENRHVVENIWKNSSFDNNRKRCRESKIPLLDKCLIFWLNQIGNNPEAAIIVDGNQMKYAAENFKKLLGEEELLISDSYLERFRNRHQIKSYSISGESSSSDLNSFQKWRTDTIPLILEKYRVEDIYNLDETGLFILINKKNIKRVIL